MLFQVSKLNEHLSIINHSQNHMQIHFTKMREREKICIWFSPKRKLKNAYENLLNYSPFTFYNYYDISQDSTHFHLVLLREFFWQKKNNLLINWYIHRVPTERTGPCCINYISIRHADAWYLILNRLCCWKKYYLLLWLESKLYYTLLHYNLPCPIYHNLKLSLYVCCRADPPH